VVSRTLTTFGRTRARLLRQPVAYAATALLLMTTHPVTAEITATFTNGADPAMHAMALWDNGTTPDNYEKKIQTFGTTLTNITNNILAFDGPHLASESRASVEINVAPRPADLNTLSFDIQASVDTSMIDTSNGAGFSRVDFQIVVTLPRGHQTTIRLLFELPLLPDVARLPRAAS
jgi:hypothetical protein